MSDLTALDESVRIGAARSELTAFMGRLQRELGLSDMTALSVMEAVLGEQRSRLCSLLAQQVIAYSNTLQEMSADGADGRDG